MALRFFITVGFILAMLAAGSSFSIFKMYQTEHTLHLDSESKVVQLQDAATAMKADLDQQKSRIADLESQVESMKQTETDLKAQTATSGTEIQNLKNTVALKNDEIKKLQDQVEDYKKKASLPAPSVKAPATEAQSATTAGTTEQTSAPSASVSSAWTVASSTPASAVIPAEAPASDDSRILTVNRKFNFIVVNLGLRDGLRMGDKVQVMQGGTQKALAQIEKIYDKFSAATLLNEDKGNPVHEGDSVKRA